MKNKRTRRAFNNEVNSGSMADIAFLLLIFFLVSTTINVDEGILVKLPPYEKADVKPPIVKTRNMCRVHVNHQDEILVRGKEMELEQIADFIKEFIDNPLNKLELSTKPTDAIVAIQNDRATSYKIYVDVYDEVKRAYNELRDEAAQIRYGIPLAACNKIQYKQITNEFPMLISESDPVDFSEVNK